MSRTSSASNFSSSRPRARICAFPRYAAAVTGISVSTQVASEYFSILAFRERIALANANIAAAKRILAITQAKVNSGVTSNLELAEQQAVLAEQESTLPGLIESEKEARWSLAILLGRAPEGFDIKAQNLDGIVAPSVQPGLPSELAAAQPDRGRGRGRSVCGTCQCGSCARGLLPVPQPVGRRRFRAVKRAVNLFNAGTFAWSIGASLLQPIFDGGRIHAQSDPAKAAQMEEFATYRKAVFTAFQDVEVALGQVKADTDQLALTDTQTRADAEAFRISELQYREGTIDILALLTNQQSLFSAQQSLVQVKLARLQSLSVTLCALGGGWEQKSDDAAYKNQLDWWPL